MPEITYEEIKRSNDKLNRISRENKVLREENNILRDALDCKTGVAGGIDIEVIKAKLNKYIKDNKLEEDAIATIVRMIVDAYPVFYSYKKDYFKVRYNDAKESADESYKLDLLKEYISKKDFEDAKEAYKEETGNDWDDL